MLENVLVVNVLKPQILCFFFTFVFFNVLYLTFKRIALFIRLSTCSGLYLSLDFQQNLHWCLFLCKLEVAESLLRKLFFPGSTRHEWWGWERRATSFLSASMLLKFLLPMKFLFSSPQQRDKHTQIG